MICLNHIDLNQEYIFSQEVDEDETKARITTSFLKFPKGSKFGKNLIDEAKKIINHKKCIKWGLIGPNFLAKEVQKYDFEEFIWDYKKTCQISWCKAKDFVKKSEFDTSQAFLHLYSEMWKFFKLNKNCFYENSIYGKLLKKHEIKDLTIKLGLVFSFKDKYCKIFFIFYSLKGYIKNLKRIFIKK